MDLFYLKSKLPEITYEVEMFRDEELFVFGLI
jgi:hypothetical protein